MCILNTGIEIFQHRSTNTHVQGIEFKATAVAFILYCYKYKVVQI
jgi:hypothetical protein